MISKVHTDPLSQNPVSYAIVSTICETIIKISFPCRFRINIWWKSKTYCFRKDEFIFSCSKRVKIQTEYLNCSGRETREVKVLLGNEHSDQARFSKVTHDCTAYTIVHVNLCGFSLLFLFDLSVTLGNSNRYSSPFVRTFRSFRSFFLLLSLWNEETF